MRPAVKVKLEKQGERCLMENKFLKGFISLQIEGLNLDRLIQFFKSNNITLYNLDRPGYKQINLSMKTTDYEKVIKLKALAPYKVTTLKTKGLPYLIKNYKLNIGLFSSVLVCLLLFMFFSTFTFNINVMGLETINRQDIVMFLQENDIRVGRRNNINNQELEVMLRSNFDAIGLVSVMQQGTNLVINVRERQIPNEQTFENLRAPFNMYITRLQVNQGTALVGVGDVVLAGQDIVAAYVENEDGERSYAQPIAQVEAEVWFVGEVIFEKELVTYTRTSNRAASSQVMLGNWSIFNKQPVHEFEHFETIATNSSRGFQNFFLPFRINREVVYELERNVEEQNFESFREQLIQATRDEARAQVPSNINPLEETLHITEQGSRVIVQTVIRAHHSF